jgi:hypothetical protein
MSNLTFDGNVKVSWVATIASTSAPTVAELTAGTALEGHITPDGLSTAFDTAAVDQSSLGSTFDSEAAGRRKPNISITYKRYTAAGAETGAESTLVYRAEGFLVVRRTKAASVAWTAADPVEVYIVQCGQPNPNNPAPNETQKATVTLFSTADPVLDATVAA